ncbi:MAG: heme-copper oxidase subunit III [Bacteroidetes bacterium]|nr:heme-copper oxidase subunit III [Bacteroidota bacterium]
MSKPTKTTSPEEIQMLLHLRIKYHPVRMFTYLLLIGITSSFLFLSLAYIMTTLRTGYPHFQLPLIFHANTVIILVSSYTLSQTRKANLAGDEKGYFNGLLVTFGLALAFALFQIIGWKELSANGIGLTNQIAGTYIYVMSGFHLVHLLFGLLALGYFLFKAFKQNRDPVKALLFETDPFSKVKVQMLCLYWHFLDGLWVYLYLFFLFNMYVLS